MYQGICDHQHGATKQINLSADAEAYIDELISQIFGNKAAPETDPNLIRAYGTKLGEAVTEGYGAKLNSFDWDTPDYHTLSALQNNVWQFSAAKSDAQLRSMHDALIGDDGKLRSFQDFKRECQQIIGVQLNWLQTEYDTAVAGAQMAAKWVKIQAEKDIFPMLEFDAVIDDHSSNICPPLNKVRLPVDHVFWTKYYPPNHFKCRSTVRQLKDGKATPEKDIQYPEKISPLFSGNVGIDGGIFNKDHSYFEGTDPHKINNATLYMPPKEQYLTRYKAEDGTPVNVNRKTDIEQKPDLETLMKVARLRADQGKVVDILPEIHAKEVELREQLLPGVPKGKNPDTVIDGEYTEIKHPSDPVTYQKIQSLIANGARQADRVIVLLDAEYDSKVLEQLANERFKVLPDLNEIGFVTPDSEYIEFFNDRGQQK